MPRQAVVMPTPRPAGATRTVVRRVSLLSFPLQTPRAIRSASSAIISSSFVGTISAWGMTGILMVVYLMASVVAAARRGIH